MGPAGAIRGGSDAVFRGPNGGWLCVCFGRTNTGQAETLEIVVKYLDSNAVERSGAAIETVESTVDPPAQDVDSHVDVVLSPDGRTAYVAIAARRPAGWSVSVRAIDISRGAPIGQKELAAIDVAPPTAEEVEQGYGTWLAGPFLRLSPDGNRLLVYHWLEKSTDSSWGRLGTSVSVVDVAAESNGGGSLGSVAALGGAIVESMGTCYYAQWLTEDSIVGLCWREEQTGGEAPMEVVSFGLDGSRVAGFDYTPDPDNGFAEPVLDTANRRLYLWSPVGHRLDVLEIERGRVETVTVDPASGAVSGDAIQNAGQWPDWKTLSSDYTPWTTRALLGDPRGTHLFAVGMKRGPNDGGRGEWYGSTGIWVFDTPTLDLVDRWQPAAPYVGLGMSRDSRWVYALSQGGADTDGNPSGWPPTVSVHDARDGRLAVQLAGFIRDQSVLLVP
jgi:hypothetical protein